MDTAQPIRVNRAPILTLWADVAASGWANRRMPP